MRGRETVEGWSQIGEKELLKAFNTQLYLRGLFCEIGLLQFSETGLTMKVDILQIGAADSAGIAGLLLTHQGFQGDGKFYSQTSRSTIRTFFLACKCFPADLRHCLKISSVLKLVGPGKWSNFLALNLSIAVKQWCMVI